MIVKIKLSTNYVIHSYQTKATNLFRRRYVREGFSRKGAPGPVRRSSLDKSGRGFVIDGGETGYVTDQLVQQSRFYQICLLGDQRLLRQHHLNIIRTSPEHNANTTWTQHKHHSNITRTPPEHRRRHHLNITWSPLSAITLKSIS